MFVTLLVCEPALASGVEAVDGAMQRGEDFFKGIIKYIGFLIGVIGIVFFLVSFPSHQTEMRLMAFIGFIVGVGIYFAPEIVSYIIGR